MKRAFVMRLLGAEPTGRIALAQALAQALRDAGDTVVVRPGRADEPSLQLEGSAAAPAPHEIVIVDGSVWPAAPGDLTLLLAFDPAGPGDLQAHAHVESRLRAELARSAQAYSVLTGSGPQRLADALRALHRARGTRSEDDEAEAARPWRWVCERCSDAACERHLLPAIDGGRRTA